MDTHPGRGGGNSCPPTCRGHSHNQTCSSRQTKQQSPFGSLTSAPLLPQTVLTASAVGFLCCGSRMHLFNLRAREKKEAPFPSVHKGTVCSAAMKKAWVPCCCSHPLIHCLIFFCCNTDCASMNCLISILLCLKNKLFTRVDALKTAFLPVLSAGMMTSFALSLWVLQTPADCNMGHCCSLFYKFTSASHGPAVCRKRLLRSTPTDLCLFCHIHMFLHVFGPYLGHNELSQSQHVSFHFFDCASNVVVVNLCFHPSMSASAKLKDHGR